MTPTLAIAQLTRFQDAINNKELSSIKPNDPLFFIRYISKNKNYFNILNDIASNHFNEVLSFVEYLKTDDWNLHIQDKYPNHDGIDLLYIAYLSNLVSREFFYDFVMFQSIIRSFTGEATSFKDKHNDVVHVPALPAAKSIIKHVASVNKTQNKLISDYIADVKRVFINSGQFCFSETQLTMALQAAGTYCLFEIKINYDSFQSLTSVWPHNVWFNLFFHSSKYAPLQVREDPSTKEISLFIPGDVLLNAFTVAISPEPPSVMQPVYAFGIVSTREEARLHQLGYHLVSILDPRFKSLARLHGRIGNSLECLLHDSIFHSIVASSHPEYIRRIFSKIYDHLNSIPNPEELFTGLDSAWPKELSMLVLNEFKSRCIELALFEREPEDYNESIYYCKETLRAVLMGTINQTLASLPTYNLNISILNVNDAIEKILWNCCTNINEARIPDLPCISYALIHEAFLITATQRGYTMPLTTQNTEDKVELELEDPKVRIANLEAQLRNTQRELRREREANRQHNTQNPGCWATFFSNCFSCFSTNDPYSYRNSITPGMDD